LKNRVSQISGRRENIVLEVLELRTKRGGRVNEKENEKWFEKLAGEEENNPTLVLGTVKLTHSIWDWQRT